MLVTIVSVRIMAAADILRNAQEDEHHYEVALHLSIVVIDHAWLRDGGKIAARDGPDPCDERT